MPVLWSALIAAAPPISGAHLSGALNPLSSRTTKQRPKKKSPVSLAAPDFFPDSLLASCGALGLSGCVHAANPSPLPGIRPLKPKPQLPVPTPTGGWADNPLSWWVLVCTNPLCGNLSTLPSASLLLHSPPWLWSSTLCHPQSPPVKGLLVYGNLSSFSAPSHWCRSHPYSLSLFFLFSFTLPRYMGSFLPFGKSGVFCHHSVGVL